MQFRCLLVADVDAEVTCLGQGDVVDAEPELGTDSIVARILGRVIHVAQLELRLVDEPLVAAKELLHEAVELSLQCRDRLLVVEVFAGRQHTQPRVRPWQRHGVVRGARVRSELLHGSQFVAGKQALVDVGHALVCVVLRCHVFRCALVQLTRSPDRDAQFDQHGRGLECGTLRCGCVELSVCHVVLLVIRPV